MSTQKCAHENETARLASLNYQISQSSYLISVIITFISTYFAIKIVQKRSIFQTSTKIVLYQNLFSANLHQIFAGIAASERLYKVLFQQNLSCIPLRSEADCALFLELVVAGVSGMIYGQTGLLVERACATFLKDYEKKKSLMISLLISFIVLSLSGVTGKMIIWDDPLDGYILYCNAFPSHSTERSTTFFNILTVISLFNLILSILIQKYNKRLEYSTQFVVGPRFRKREVIDSTTTICFLTLIQFILMFIYSFGISIFRTIRDWLTYEQYYFWVVWIYTIPFTAAVFPVLLIYRIQSSRTNRVMTIKSFTSKKQTQEDHIKQMKNAWN